MRLAHGGRLVPFFVSENLISDQEGRLTEFPKMLREAAEIARKATTRLLLWLFIALLCGAFFASLFATFGGCRRDSVAAVSPDSGT